MKGGRREPRGGGRERKAVTLCFLPLPLKSKAWEGTSEAALGDEALRAGVRAEHPPRSLTAGRAPRSPRMISPPASVALQRSLSLDETAAR